MNALFILWLAATHFSAKAPHACQTLECAVIEQDHHRAVELLKAGADANITVSLEFTHAGKQQTRSYPALQYALAEGNQELAVALLEYGAQPVFDDKASYTALILSIEKGLDRVVSFIVENEIEPVTNSTTTSRYDPLSTAISRRRYGILDTLLEHGANVNYFYSEQPSLGALNSALLNGDEYAVRELIEHGLEITTPEAEHDRYSATYATENVHDDLLSDLVAHGLPLEVAVNDSTPGSAARANCRHQERIFAILKKYSYDFCEPWTDQGLLMAESKSRQNGYLLLSPFSEDIIRSTQPQCAINQLKTLVKPCTSPGNTLACKIEKDVAEADILSAMGGAQVHLNGVSLTAFEYALLLGSQRIAVAFLADGSPEIDHCDVNGMPLLHRAIVLGRFRVVNFILASGSGDHNRFLCPSNELSALHRAALELDLQQVRQVLAGGHDPNAQDSSGFTPLAFALALGADDIAMELLESGADAAAITNSGHTMLHFAALGETAHLLPDSAFDSLDPKQRDRIDGRTALLSGAASECEADKLRAHYTLTDACVTDRYGNSYYDYRVDPRQAGGRSVMSRALAGRYRAEIQRCSSARE